MKNFYNYLIGIAMIAGIFMIGCGSPPSTPNATDGVGSSVGVTWEGGAADVLRSPDPEVNWSSVPAIATGTESPYEDTTADANTVYFYALSSGDEITNYDGGFHGTTGGSIDSTAWSSADITCSVYLRYDPANTELLAGTPGTYTLSGATSGSMTLILEYNDTFSQGFETIVYNDFEHLCSGGLNVDGSYITKYDTTTIAGTSEGLVTFSDTVGSNDGKQDFNLVFTGYDEVAAWVIYDPNTSHTYITTGDWSDTEHFPYY